jgi:hypothetical protein
VTALQEISSQIGNPEMNFFLVTAPDSLSKNLKNAAGAFDSLSNFLSFTFQMQIGNLVYAKRVLTFYVLAEIFSDVFAVIFTKMVYRA